MAKKRKRKVARKIVKKAAPKAVKKPAAKKSRAASEKNKNSKVKKLIQIAKMKVSQKQKSGLFARLFGK